MKWMLLMMLGVAAWAGDGFKWVSGEGQTDLLYNGKKVIRAMHLPYDTANVHDTYKVFHHVFRSDGERLLTKGPGGKFTHHRGIFYGYARISYDGRKGTVDSWHCKNGAHIKYLETTAQTADDKSASHTLKYQVLPSSG